MGIFKFLSINLLIDGEQKSIDNADYLQDIIYFIECKNGCDSHFLSFIYDTFKTNGLFKWTTFVEVKRVKLYTFLKKTLLKWFSILNEGLCTHLKALDFTWRTK